MSARGLAIRSDLDATALRRFAQGEADRRAALRALAIAQALEGASRAEVARVVGRECQSLRDALHAALRRVPPGDRFAMVRYNAEGLARLRDRLRPGRREKLDKVRQEECGPRCCEGRTRK